MIIRIFCKAKQTSLWSWMRFTNVRRVEILYITYLLNIGNDMETNGLLLVFAFCNMQRTLIFGHKDTTFTSITRSISCSACWARIMFIRRSRRAKAGWTASSRCGNSSTSLSSSSTVRPMRLYGRSPTKAMPANMLPTAEGSTWLVAAFHPRPARLKIGRFRNNFIGVAWKSLVGVGCYFVGQVSTTTDIEKKIYSYEQASVSSFKNRRQNIFRSKVWQSQK